MRQSGSSIIEVVVMIVIISVSVVGIYSLVNSAQKLAKTADDRLIATNLAREWLETIGALRDTFTLRSYSANDCFFTIDGSNLDDDKCYRDGALTGTKYYLLDDKTLATTPVNIPVCINTDGWYSQESSKTGVDCKTSPLCGWTLQKECQTQFTRSIVFEPCGTDMTECVTAKVNIVWWKKKMINSILTQDQSLTLEQTFTRH